MGGVRFLMCVVPLYMTEFNEQAGASYGSWAAGSLDLKLDGNNNQEEAEEEDEEGEEEATHVESNQTGGFATFRKVRLITLLLLFVITLEPRVE